MRGGSPDSPKTKEDIDELLAEHELSVKYIKDKERMFYATLARNKEKAEEALKKAEEALKKEEEALKKEEEKLLKKAKAEEAKQRNSASVRTKPELQPNIFSFASHRVVPL